MDWDWDWDMVVLLTDVLNDVLTLAGERRLCHQSAKEEIAFLSCEFAKGDVEFLSCFFLQKIFFLLFV